MTEDENALRLAIIAAKAQLLAQAVKSGSLWPGQLTEGLNEIRGQLEQCEERGSRL